MNGLQLAHLIYEVTKISDKENYRQMKVRLLRYADKYGDGWSYSFAILPEIEFHWTGGRLRVIYIGWLIWDLVLDFDNKY